MKIKIITVGKLKEKYLQQGIAEYTKRLSAYCNLKVIEVNDEKAPENYSDAQIEYIKKIEGNKILSKIDEDDYIISLAIEGKQISSEVLAQNINDLMTYGNSKIVFIIGGSNGLSPEVINRSNLLLSFSKMTFPHQLMRLVLLEQIYRAFKIIKNEPYHK